MAPCPAWPDTPHWRKDAPRVSYRDRHFWQPDVTVATVVVRDGQLLVVDEEVRGLRVLNQPAGHLEPDESVLEAALRETLEETAWHVRLTCFIGAYQWKAPETGRHYMRLAFGAEPVQHEPDRPLDTGIVEALWMTPAALAAESARHRSPLVWKVVEDYLAGRRFPLDVLTQVP